MGDISVSKAKTQPLVMPQSAAPAGGPPKTAALDGAGGQGTAAPGGNRGTQPLDARALGRGTGTSSLSLPSKPAGQGAGAGAQDATAAAASKARDEKAQREADDKRAADATAEATRQAPPAAQAQQPAPTGDQPQQKSLMDHAQGAVGKLEGARSKLASFAAKFGASALAGKAAAEVKPDGGSASLAATGSVQGPQVKSENGNHAIDGHAKGEVKGTAEGRVSGSGSILGGALAGKGSAEGKAEGKLNAELQGHASFGKDGVDVSGSTNVGGSLKLDGQVHGELSQGNGAVSEKFDAQAHLEAQSHVEAEGHAKVSATQIDLGAKAGASASASASTQVEAKVSVAGGAVEGDVQAKVSAQASASATADAHANVGMDKDHHFHMDMGAGASLQASAGADAGLNVSGKVGDATIGLQVNAGLTGGVGASASAGMSYDNGTLKVSVSESLGALIGERAGATLTIHSDTMGKAVDGVANGVSKASEALASGGRAVADGVSGAWHRVFG